MKLRSNASYDEKSSINKLKGKRNKLNRRNERKTEIKQQLRLIKQTTNTGIESVRAEYIKSYNVEEPIREEQLRLDLKKKLLRSKLTEHVTC